MRLTLKFNNIFFLFFCLLFYFVCSCQKSQKHIPAKSLDAKKLPFKIEILAEIPTAKENNYIVHDLDNDGTSEIIIVGGKGKNDPEAGYSATISDLFLNKALEQINFVGKIQVSFLDVNKDGTKEIFISEQVGDSLFLNIYTHQGKKIKRFFITTGKARDEHPWRCSVTPVDMLDINENGRLDLLLRVHTDYAYQPRGLFAIDYLSNEIIDTFLTGAQLDFPKISDLNKNGFPEIIMGSAAPGNGDGEIVNGFDDMNSYLFILNFNLQKIIQRRLGGEYSSIVPHVHDMDHDGKPEILIFKNSHNLQNQENSFVCFWNFEKQIMYNKKTYEQSIFENTIFFDFNGDGIDEFLTMKFDGQLEVRNLNNEVEVSYSLGEKLTGNVRLFDLNSDGDEEIIISSISTIYIFTKHLKLLSKFNSIDPLKYQIYSEGLGLPKGLFVSSGAKSYYLQMKRNYSAVFNIGIVHIISFITGGLSMLIILLLFRYHRGKNLSHIFNQNYFELSDRGLFTIDSKGFIDNINTKARDLFDLKDVILFRNSLNTLFVGKKFDQLRSLVQTALTEEIISKKHHVSFKTGEYKKELLVSFTPIRSRLKKLQKIIVHIDDITSLSQTKKILAWAAMAQRLAHKIKTPMSSVMLAVQRLQMEYKRDRVKKAKIYDKYVEYACSEIQNVRQAADDFMKLLQFEEPEFSKKNVDDVLMECVNLLQNLKDNRIEIVTDFANQLPLVNIDKNQLRVAIQIILDNSLESMAENGKLTITTRLAQTLQSSGTNNVNNYVKVEIADTGNGIHKETMPKIFEPFFTTKQQGTGLGLTIAKKIIEDHHGTINISSEKDIGTIVTISLVAKF